MHWSLWLAAIPTLLVAIYLALLALTARRSAAGIVTSRTGRALRFGADITRATLRWLWRTIRRRLTPAAKRAELDRRFHEETAKNVLETMGNMKGVLMKLGQIVSFMDETLPAAYQEQLARLQSSAPPMDYDAVVRVIQGELGADPERLFATFDAKPIASASIGQVHRAQLLDGTEVAVKIQYPGVDAAIRGDLDNYGMLMAMIGAVTPTLDARPIVDELRGRLLDELDYRLEADHQELFFKLFAGHKTIVIPRVFRERSSQRVLTTEFIRGTRFYDFLDTASAEEKRLAVLTIREFVFDSIWHHHVFNGDPHPGNYLMLGNGRVAFLDFGCVKRFDPQFIADFQVLNRAYLVGDIDAYFAQACKMRFIKAGYEEKVDKQWMWQYASWFYAPIAKDEKFAFTPEYCKQALAQIFGDNMRKLNMPPDYVMLNRITFGLNSIMSRLGAHENWRRLSTSYYFPDGHDPGLAPDTSGAGG